MRIKKFLCGAVLLPALAAALGQAEPELELNGYELGQYRDAIRPLGEPFNSLTDEDGWVNLAYTLPGCPGVYMVFSFEPNHQHEISGLQITGPPCLEMQSFHGLHLGSSRAEIWAALGKPATVKDEPDLKLQLWGFEGTNYSVEVDSEGRLYSIKLIANRSFAEKPTGAPSLADLIAALHERQPKGLLRVIDPGIEIYRNGEVVSFRRGALDDLVDGKSPISRALFDPGGVLAALDEAAKEAEPNIRLSEKGPPTVVYKLPARSPVEEIVYRAFAGRWLVWEIRFRKLALREPSNTKS